MSAADDRDRGRPAEPGVPEPTPEQIEELCAHLLGELEDADERRRLEEELERSPFLRTERDRLASTMALVQKAYPPRGLSDDKRAELVAAAEHAARRRRFTFLRGGGGLVKLAASLALLLGAGFLLRAYFDGTRLPWSAPESERVAHREQGGWAEDELAREASGLAPVTTGVEVDDLNGLGYGGEDASRRADLAGGRVAPEEKLLEDSEELAAAAAPRLRAVGGVATAPAPAGEPGTPDAQGALEGFVGGKNGVLQSEANRNEPGLTTIYRYVDLAAASERDNAQVRAKDGRYRGPGDSGPAPGEQKSEQEVARALQNMGYGGNEPVVEGGEDRKRSRQYAQKERAPARERVSAEALNERLRRGAEMISSSPAAKKQDFYDAEPSEEEAGELEVFLRARAQEPAEEPETSEVQRMLQELGYDGGEGGESDAPAAATPDQDLLDQYVPDQYVPPGQFQDGDDALEGERQGGRRLVLTDEELVQLGDEVLTETRARPGEAPRAQFFRYWGESPPVETREDPLSTFAADVDTASYALARRMLQGGFLPAREQVRTEEFVNYFPPDVAAPTDGSVFALELEAAPTPFANDPAVECLRVTLRGKEIDAFERQPLALTFVVDVSGSMKDGGRLEQVKEALLLLVRQLSATDSIALVAFSKEARVVSPMVSAANLGALEDAVDALAPEGGTNVAAGLRAGFALAAEALTPHAVNRVILFSDGVGNIGDTDQEAILASVEEHRAEGLYLNTIGVGLANHDDRFLEQLADRGDGVCNYVDSLAEAEKVVVDDFTKTLQPIARDVKIQVELDPEQVASYRQLGYENRVVADADFRNDAVDAGEVNAGHQVSALYEIVRLPVAPSGRPLATARVRYKPPFAVDRGSASAFAKVEAEKALELQVTLDGRLSAGSFRAASPGFRRTVLVAQFAELLRRSLYTRGDSYELLVAEARALAGALRQPAFDEFVSLLELARPRVLAQQAAEEADDLGPLLDELARLHYADGLRAQLELDEDEAVTGSRDDEIRRLEEEVRLRLRRRFGAPVEMRGELAPVAPGEPAESLEDRR